MSRKIDVLVAGSVPVGLATAIYAAKSGLEVVVCDPRSGDMDKACGEASCQLRLGTFASLTLS